MLAQPPLEGFGWWFYNCIALIPTVICSFQGPLFFFLLFFFSMPYRYLSFLYFFSRNFQHADVNAVLSEEEILTLKLAVLVLLSLTIYSASSENFSPVCFRLHYISGKETEAEINTFYPGKQCHRWNTIEDFLIAVQWPVQKPCFSLACGEIMA